MRRTLFLIPHELAGLPLFGWGWLLGLMVLGAVLLSLWMRRGGGNVRAYWSQNGFLWVILAAAVVLVLPRVELANLQGDPVGLPVRGYGVMLLAGIVAAVWLAIVRAKRYGFDPDVILSIAPWGVVGGILGARLFYVVEYRQQFFYGDLLSSLQRALNFTEGGLVVYGSFIGGFLAGAIAARRLGLPFWRLGDVIIPSLFIGLALGRIGCLLNGCCYGGVCEEGWAALRFPNGSPVFQDQLASGQLLGITLSATGNEITAVQPGSLAEQQRLQPGDRIDSLNAVRSVELAAADRPAEDTQFGAVAVVRGVEYYWSAKDLPRVAGPVMPTQIIGAAGGLLLCLGLCWLSRSPHRDGTILLVGCSAYAVMRFGLEILRNDEPGQFGTALTISQWVSVAVLVVSAIAWWTICSRQKPAVSTDRH